MGGYRIPSGQNVTEAFEALRKTRIRATQSYINALEEELQLGPQNDNRKIVVNNDLVRLRSRLASPTVVPSVYALNTKVDLMKLDQVENHSLVGVIRVLSQQSQGEPVFPSP